MGFSQEGPSSTTKPVHGNPVSRDALVTFGSSLWAPVSARSKDIVAGSHPKDYKVFFIFMILFGCLLYMRCIMYYQKRQTTMVDFSESKLTKLQSDKKKKTTIVFIVFPNYNCVTQFINVTVIYYI